MKARCITEVRNDRESERTMDLKKLIMITISYFKGKIYA